jgi:hypothetical protein
MTEVAGSNPFLNLHLKNGFAGTSLDVRWRIIGASLKPYTVAAI